MRELCSCVGSVPETWELNISNIDAVVNKPSSVGSVPVNPWHDVALRPTPPPVPSNSRSPTCVGSVPDRELDAAH